MTSCSKADERTQLLMPDQSITLHDLEHIKVVPAYSVHMDAMRSLAAFLVVAGHARLLFFGDHGAAANSSTINPDRGNNDSAQHLGLGHHAVIVFFVLSGFLVGSSAWRAVRSDRWSWNRYLVQRMTRLWIVLLPALVIGGCLDYVGIRSFAGSHSIYAAPPGQGMVTQAFAGTLSAKVLVENAFFLQTIYGPTFGTNVALWSLANEFWYYMIFPLLLLPLAASSSLLRRVISPLFAAAILAFVGTKIAVLFPVWLLGFGVSLLPLYFRPATRRLMLLLCLGQFLAVNAMIRLHPIAPLLADLALGITTALLLYSILHSRQPVRSPAYRLLATFFARFSYTLYLTHLPALVMITAIVIHPWHPWRKDAPHLLAAVGIIAVVYVYSWLLYLLFERNTDRWRTYWISLRSRPGTTRE